MIHPDMERGMPILPFDYQDWLAGQGAIKRGDLDPGRWEVAVPPNRSRMTRRLIAFLGQSPGYLRSTRDISLHLRRSDARSELYATHHLALKSGQYLHEPDSLFVNALCQGVGVEDFLHTASGRVIDPIHINSLYLLWANLGKFVDTKLLADSLYGEANGFTVRYVSQSCSGLNEMFGFKDAVVEDATVDKTRYYRLKIGEGLPERKRRRVNAIKDREYQDWLVAQGLITYSTQHPRKIQEEDLIKSHPLSKRQKEVVDHLRKYGGYLVPTEKVAQLFWGAELPNNWKARMSRNLSDLRDKCFDRGDIFSLESDAWGVGIDEVYLTPQDLNGLYPLWAQRNNFVPLAQVPGNRENFRKYGLSKIRYFLSPEYAIGSRGEGDSLEYILIKGRELVSYRGSEGQTG